MLRQGFRYKVFIWDTTEESPRRQRENETGMRKQMIRGASHHCGKLEDSLGTMITLEDFLPDGLES